MTTDVEIHAKSTSAAIFINVLIFLVLVFQVNMNDFKKSQSRNNTR